MRRILTIALLALAGYAAAQVVAVKNNLLYDATGTPNLGVEISLGKRWTTQAFYGLNPWHRDEDKSWRHWVVMPELRYWFCSVFNGHFVGIHALGGEFNLAGISTGDFGHHFTALDDVRHHHYEGWYVGGGLTYGYQWTLSRHWNLEASIGFGYVYLDYKKYQCTHCGYLEDDGDKHYIGPTKEALSLIYIF